MTSRNPDLIAAITRMQGLDGLLIRTGIQGTEASARKDTRQDDGSIAADPELSLVEVAVDLEYGNKQRRIPEYAPYRRCAEADGPRWLAALATRVKAYAASKDAAKFAKGLREVALATVSDIKATITETDTPPNSQYTIDRKGSDGVLRDTGQFLNSQRSEIVIPGSAPFPAA